MSLRVVIVDCYTDEPAGLGVPPYLDIYPRYIAGAVWHFDPSIRVFYVTIDQVRLERRYLDLVREAKLVIVIAGVCTPGSYLKYRPATLDELIWLGDVCQGKVSVICGPVAKFGYGSQGGEIAKDPSVFRRYYDLVVSGDPDLVIYELLKCNLEASRVSCDMKHRDETLINIFAVKGAKIAEQHPCYGKNLIVEIELYRSCPRYIIGGCSFCVTVRHGPVLMRSVREIVREIETLYRVGVRHFRLGRQADFYSYMAKDTGKVEFPRPNPEAIERLLHGTRAVAPEIKTLHIDNVNPGTVYHWPRESTEVTKILMLYHTPGDVAAMGIETADPRVVKINNLKVYPEEAYQAIKLISKIGHIRGWNGMPHFLPGINFVLGLPGETKETYRLNKEFLEKLLEERIPVRRVNIRLALVLPGTPLWHRRDEVKSNLRRHRRYIESFRYWVRHVFDVKNLKYILPPGTVLKEVFTELHDEQGTYARQVGSYPLVVYIPEILPLETWIDVVVVDHLPRSIIAVPYPLNINKASPSLIKKLPGMDNRKLAEVLKHRPFKSIEEVKSILGETAKYVTV